MNQTEKRICYSLAIGNAFGITIYVIFSKIFLPLLRLPLHDQKIWNLCACFISIFIIIVFSIVIYFMKRHSEKIAKKPAA